MFKHLALLSYKILGLYFPVNKIRKTIWADAAGNIKTEIQVYFISSLVVHDASISKKDTYIKLHKHQSEEKDDDIVFSLLVFGHIENIAWFMTQPENDIWLVIPHYLQVH